MISPNTALDSAASAPLVFCASIPADFAGEPDRSHSGLLAAFVVALIFEGLVSFAQYFKAWVFFVQLFEASFFFALLCEARSLCGMPLLRFFGGCQSNKSMTFTRQRWEPSFTTTSVPSRVLLRSLRMCLTFTR